jgi:phage-related protein
VALIAKIIGEAAIRLRAESKTLGPEIRRLVTTAVKRAAADVRQDLRGEEGMTEGIRKDVEKTAETSSKAFGRIRSALASVGKEILLTSLKAVGLSVAIGAVASSLSGTAALVGGLGQAVAGLGAAAAGVGIAGLTAFLAASTAVKLATSGMGDAFKAVASGDAKALQEALKGMTPEARSFVTETAKLKPLFDEIKLATQAALFKGLGKEVLATGRAIGPTFKSLFVGVAEQLNVAATGVLQFMREARTISDLDQISKNVTGGFREMSGAGRSIAQVIVDIVKSASALLPGLGKSIADITAKFAAFIRLKSDSGELTAFFQQGIETVKQFGRILRDFGVGIANVFKIGSDAGGGFLNILERAATGFRNFTESIGGQAILRTLFGTIGDISDAFGRFLSALSPLLPLLGRLASVIGDSVIRILDELGPVLEEVGRAVIDALIETLPILVPVIIKVAEGFAKIIKAVAPLLPVLAKVLDALTPLIDPFVRLVEAILPPLVRIIEKLTPVIELLATGLGLIVDVIANVIEGFANLGRTLELALDPIGTTNRFIAVLTGNLEVLGPRVSKGFRAVGHDAMKAIEAGLEDGRPGTVEKISRNLEDLFATFAPWPDRFFRAGGLTWAEVGRGITTEQQAVVDRLNQAAQALLNFLTGKKDDFAIQGRSFAESLATGLTAGQQEAVNRIRAVIDNLLGALTGRRPSFETEGRAISERLGGGIDSGKQNAVSAAQNAANSVLNVFGGLSLFSEGASIMNSLRSGLVSGIQAVKNVLTSMTSLIPSWKGPESTDRKLLVPAGKAIMGGLVTSIESEIPALRSVLAKVTDEVSTALDPLAGTPLDFTPAGLAAHLGGATAAGTFVLQQTNIAPPGADINQFSAEVWKRGAADLASGNSSLNVALRPLQAGIAAPGSVVNLGA